MAKLAGALLLVVACLFVLPSSAEVLNITDAQFEQHKNKRWVLGFTASFCGEPCEHVDALLVDFESKFGEHVKVGRVAHNDDLTLRFKVEAYPTIYYLREGSYYMFDGNRTVDTLMKFCAGDYKHYNPHPVPPQQAYTDYVIQLNDENFERNVMSRRGSYWAVLFIDASDTDTAIVDVHYKELATAMKGKVRVARVEKAAGPATATRFQAEFPSLWVFRGGKRYPHEHSFVYEDMLSFTEGGFVNATTAIDVKPLPTTEDDSSDVVVLTDETFDSATQATSSRGKTWFIEFYAPWCGHCKAIAPTWEQVAQELKARMFVGKLDCVQNKNTSERFDIPGFPTLLLFRGGKYWKYDGELRTKEAFLEWALDGYAKKEGLPVPPPFGQPPPEPSVLDQLENAGAALSAMWDHNRWAVLSLFGVGFSGGAGFTLYIALLKALLRAAAPRPVAKKRPVPKTQAAAPKPAPAAKPAPAKPEAAKKDKKESKKQH